MIHQSTVSQLHLGTSCLESSSGLSTVQKLSGGLYNHFPNLDNGVTQMSRNSIVALNGANNLASALADDTLSVTGSSELIPAGFNSGVPICEYCGFSHEILAGCKFDHGTIPTTPVTFSSIQFHGLNGETVEPFALFSDDSIELIPSENHNGVDMFILSDGTLIDTYAPKLLPSGRAAKRDSEHSEYSDWNIRRMVLTGKARKMRDAANSLGETVDTDSQVLVSFRVTSLRGIRLVNEAIASGKGYSTASHFVASKFLSTVPELTFSDLSKFRDPAKKSGAVAVSSSTVAENAAGLNKAKLLEMLAKMSDADVLALTGKLMA